MKNRDVSVSEGDREVVNIKANEMEKRGGTFV